MPAKRKVVGLWPCFYATIRLLCHCSREHIFVISREATTLTFFSVTLQGCKLLPSLAMTMHNDLFYVLSWWANNNNTIFLSYRMRERASEQWPRGIAKSEPVHVLSWWANDFIIIRERSEVYFTCRIARSDGDERIFTSYPKWRWRNRVREHVYHCKDATT